MKLTIIKGDIFPLTFNPGSIDINKIQNVYFSSHFLGITKEFTLTDKVYMLELSPEETEKLRAGKGTYDVTVYFTDKKPVTVIHCVEIEVLAKENKVKIE